MDENLQSVENTLSLYNYEKGYQIVIYNLCFYYDCSMKIFYRAKSSILVLFIALIASCSFTEKKDAIFYTVNMLNQFDSSKLYTNQFIEALRKEEYVKAEEARTLAVKSFHHAKERVQKMGDYKGDGELRIKMENSLADFQRFFTDEMSQVVKLHRRYSLMNAGTEESYNVLAELDRLDIAYATFDKEQALSIGKTTEEFCSRHGLLFSVDEGGKINIQTK